MGYVAGRRSSCRSPRGRVPRAPRRRRRCPERAARVEDGLAARERAALLGVATTGAASPGCGSTMSCSTFRFWCGTTSPSRATSCSPRTPPGTSSLPTRPSFRSCSISRRRRPCRRRLAHSARDAVRADGAVAAPSGRTIDRDDFTSGLAELAEAIECRNGPRRPTRCGPGVAGEAPAFYRSSAHPFRETVLIGGRALHHPDGFVASRGHVPARRLWPRSCVDDKHALIVERGISLSGSSVTGRPRTYYGSRSLYPGATLPDSGPVRPPRAEPARLGTESPCVRVLIDRSSALCLSVLASCPGGAGSRRAGPRPSAAIPGRPRLFRRLRADLSRRRAAGPRAAKRARSLSRSPAGCGGPTSNPRRRSSSPTASRSTRTSRWTSR